MRLSDTFNSTKIKIIVMIRVKSFTSQNLEMTVFTGITGSRGLHFVVGTSKTLKTITNHLCYKNPFTVVISITDHAVTVLHFRYVIYIYLD